MQRPSVEEQNHNLFRLITPTIFISNVFSEFAQGIGKAPPEIDNSSCRKLLRRSVATLCAHSGYDGKRFEMCINSLLLCEKDPIYIVQVKNKPKNKILFVKLPSYLVVYFLIRYILGCTESVLETLTDSCHEYLLQMTKLMRQAVDAEAREGASPFPVG